MKENDKQLSIIIPVYNMEKFLPKCIKSLENQKFDDSVEIIFIDDGSFDSSSKILDQVVMTNNNMNVFHQTNAGVANARNYGLQVAKGKYIAWIDPYDYITNDWWKVISPLLKQNIDMIYFDMIIKRGNMEYTRYFQNKSYMLNHDELCRELARGDRIQSHLCSKIILRTYYLRTKTERGYVFDPTLSYCEDFDALHYICWPVKKCMYLHKAIYVYRQRDDSIVNNRNNKLQNFLLGIKLYKKRYGFYKYSTLNINKTGILLAECRFILEYSIYSTVEEKGKYHKFYKKYRHDFFINGWKLLNDKHVLYREKIIIFLILFHLEKICFKLKNIFKYLTKG